MAKTNTKNKSRATTKSNQSKSLLKAGSKFRPSRLTFFVLAFALIGLAAIAASSAATFKPVTPGTSWQWQIDDKEVNTTVLDNVANSKKLYDIDLENTSAATISTLKSKGITVICYYSAGSWEDWRSDSSKFPANVKGQSNGWPGEKWLDIRNIGVLGPIMSARMSLASQKGCDGVEPDNVDGYSNNTGFPLTANDQLIYNQFLATEAHKYGLSVALKNDVDQIASLVNYFDFAVNEQCYEYSECENYSLFIAQNKAVLGVEYSGTPAPNNSSNFCYKANASNYDWLKKNLALDASRTACREGNGTSTPPVTPPNPPKPPVTPPTPPVTPPNPPKPPVTPPTPPVTPPATTPNPPTTSLPSIEIIKPQFGANIGYRNRIKATASSSADITKMEIYIDGKLKKSTDGDEISYRWRIWNLRRLARGAHAVTIKAYDSAGNVGQSTVTMYRGSYGY